MNTGAAAQGVLFGLGALSGVEKVAPFAVGDVIVKADGARHVITGVDDNIHGLVFLTVNIGTGRECVVLEREVEYRSR